MPTDGQEWSDVDNDPREDLRAKPTSSSRCQTENMSFISTIVLKVKRRPGA